MFEGYGFMRSFLFIFALLMIVAFPVLAQETYQCGVPDNPKLEKTDDPAFWKYCDYHTRRFQYAAEQKEFRRMLDERRENYVRYREAALRNYQDELISYYAGIQ